MKNLNQKYLKGITIRQLDQLKLSLVVSAMNITKLKRQTVFTRSLLEKDISYVLLEQYDELNYGFKMRKKTLERHTQTYCSNGFMRSGRNPVQVPS